MLRSMGTKQSLLLLLLGIAVLQILTMPRYYYVGDNYATRAEAINLVNTGRLGISYDEREELKRLVLIRGQYFFQNDEKERFFSKYGIGLTIAQLPPVLLEKLIAPELGLVQRTDSLLLFLNLYHVILALVSAFYLYVICALFTRSELSRVAFVLLSIYATFLWHYLRAPAHEIYQIPLFLALSFHFLAFLRLQSRQRDGWGHLAATLAALLGLVLMKSFYVLILPLIWIFALLHLQGWSTHRKQIFLFLAAPTAITLTILLTINALKFGSIIESGYGQWLTDRGVQADRFSLSFFGKRFQQYVLQAGNWNLWVHYPIALIALGGVQRFSKNHRVETLFIISMSGVLFATTCCFSTLGSWCYGPRLLLPVLIIGSLPFLEVLDWIRETRSLKSSVAAVSCIVLLGISLELQINVNSLDYFAHQECRAVFHTLDIEEVDRYFDGTVHRGLVCGDLLAFRSGSRSFFPLDFMAARMKEEGGETLLAQSMYASGEENLRRLLGLNYYFVPR